MNKSAAIALGKALFWDTNVGSDGRTACATCHFHAGADSRNQNALSPGVKGFGRFDLQRNFNVRLTANDFPFHRPRSPDDGSDGLQRQNSAVASSPGVFKQKFVGLVPGSGVESVQNIADAVFQVGGVNVRQVEPRNTPTVINAGFNLRQFWDGRAQTIFNGVNNWGNRDTAARVYRLVNGTLTPVRVAINDASLASQAVGPPVSDLEMRAAGRLFPDLGRKMMGLRPLVGQAVSAGDSVLGPYRHSSGLGLSPATYAELVRAAFGPQWWSSGQQVALGGRYYTQAEANFSLFWGLALQLYQATLVSDQAPYDRFVDGSTTALTTQQIQGLGLFMGKGRCVSCHGGATFTNAAIRRVPLSTVRMSNMVMGDGQFAVYDEGFYNIGVRRTTHDPAVGASDPWGKPLSFSGLAKLFNTQFGSIEGDVPNVAVSTTSRIAVNGAFKTPTLRNVALTAPYFHDGGTLDLRGVVEFYNRGGDTPRENRADLDADIRPLGLTTVEVEALTAFLHSLTDERVRRHAAPFDHPELIIPEGHPGHSGAVSVDSTGKAVDLGLRLLAVGAAGYPESVVPRNFERRLPAQPLSASLALGLTVQVHSSGMCLDVQGRSMVDGARLVQMPCTGASTQQWIEERVASGVMFRNAGTGKCIDAEAGGYVENTPAVQWACHGGDHQVFNWSDNRLQVRHSGACLVAQGNTMDAGGLMALANCRPRAPYQKFTMGMMLRSALNGGTGGQGFVDPVAPDQRLRSVVIRASEVIDAVQGVTSAGDLPLHGGSGNFTQSAVVWPSDEFLIGIDGVEGTRFGIRVIGRLTFITNTGRRLGPFGAMNFTTDQTPFSLRAPAGKHVIGFHGRSSSLLDAIGLLYSD